MRRCILSQMATKALYGRRPRSRSSDEDEELAMNEEGLAQSLQGLTTWSNLTMPPQTPLQSVSLRLRGIGGACAGLAQLEQNSPSDLVREQVLVDVGASSVGVVGAATETGGEVAEH